MTVDHMLPDTGDEYLDAKMQEMLPKIVAAAGLSRDSIYVDLQPGNGTRYDIVITATPNGDVIALPEFHAAAYAPVGGYVSVSYVEEKLGLGQADAHVIATFLSLR